jgi:type III pantothenate kinase
MGAAYLLINNNNSRTKFALSDPESLREERAVIATPSLDPEALASITAGWAFDAVILASVVPRTADLIRRTWPDRPFLEVSHRLQLGVTLDLPDPSTLGADRLANIAAMADQGPCIVVDFGTAVTFNVVASQRRFWGGMIAPGLNALTDYLHERTALLPKIEIDPTLADLPPAIGKSTRGAMLAGAVYGFRGMIKEILTALEFEINGGTQHVQTVATGGYAELISSQIPAIDAVLPDLTLDGMRIIANLNLT